MSRFLHRQKLGSSYIHQLSIKLLWKLDEKEAAKLNMISIDISSDFNWLILLIL